MDQVPTMEEQVEIKFKKFDQARDDQGKPAAQFEVRVNKECDLVWLNQQEIHQESMLWPGFEVEFEKALIAYSGFET